MDYLSILILYSLCVIMLLHILGILNYGITIPANRPEPDPGHETESGSSSRRGGAYARLCGMPGTRGRRGRGRRAAAAPDWQRQRARRGRGVHIGYAHLPGTGDTREQLVPDRASVSGWGTPSPRPSRLGDATDYPPSYEEVATARDAVDGGQGAIVSQPISRTPPPAAERGERGAHADAGGREAPPEAGENDALGQRAPQSAAQSLADSCAHSSAESGVDGALKDSGTASISAQSAKSDGAEPLAEIGETASNHGGLAGHRDELRLHRAERAARAAEQREVDAGRAAERLLGAISKVRREVQEPSREAAQALDRPPSYLSHNWEEEPINLRYRTTRRDTDGKVEGDVTITLPQSFPGCKSRQEELGQEEAEFLFDYFTARYEAAADSLSGEAAGGDSHFL